MKGLSMKKQKTKISHMQYEFPLGKVPLNIHPSNFKQFFGFSQIVLPVFQRKYCWDVKQFEAFWNDLVAITYGQRIGQSHTIGKIVLFETGKSSLIVLDGQQRVTTTIILLCVMRDCLQAFEKRIQKQIKSQKKLNTKDVQNKENSKASQTKSVEELMGSIKHIETVVNSINSQIYSNKDKSKIKSNDDIINMNDKTDEKKSDDELKEGLTLDYIRFCPTFLDRLPFYQAVLTSIDEINKNKNKKEKKEKEKEKSKSKSNVNNNDGDDHVYNCRQFFYNKASKCTIEAITRLYNNLMIKFTFVFVGLPNKYSDKAYWLYQWFFEKSLLGDRLLLNRRPGELHRINELFKNYILAYFINQTKNKQNEIYQIWLRIEKNFDTLNDFDLYLLRSSIASTEELVRSWIDSEDIIAKKKEKAMKRSMLEHLEMAMENNSLTGTNDKIHNKNSGINYTNDIASSLTGAPLQVVTDTQDFDSNENKNENKNKNNDTVMKESSVNSNDKEKKEKKEEEEEEGIKFPLSDEDLLELANLDVYQTYRKITEYFETEVLKDCEEIDYGNNIEKFLKQLVDNVDSSSKRDNDKTDTVVQN